jgi:putative transposase
VGTRVRELVREICRANDIEIVKGHVGKDHVHLLVSVPPYLSVSKVMQYLKGKTSHKLLMEFAHLRRTRISRLRISFIGSSAVFRRKGTHRL